MYLSPQQRRYLGKIIPFGLIWLAFAFVYVLIERGLLGPLNYYPSTENPYDFQYSVVILPLSSLIMGWFFGIVEVLWLNKLFSRSSFGVKILGKALIYLLVICLFLIGLTLMGNSIVMDLPAFDPEVLDTAVRFFGSFAFISVVIYMGAAVITTLFLIEVSDNLGQGVMKNFLLGRYHKPREEERIFMFLDMKSSTTIAERLGHVKYFQLLTEYYREISNAIVQTSGKIYQYVGDEVIVSWGLTEGVDRNNCLRCFFLAKEMLESKSETFESSFGVLPEFKAGMHVGLTTTGEIGTVKKEIVFSGDVLNTTARIQASCKEFDEDLLISGQLLARLELDGNYQVEDKGQATLRGRDEAVTLYGVSSG